MNYYIFNTKFYCFPPNMVTKIKAKITNIYLIYWIVFDFLQFVYTDERTTSLFTSSVSGGSDPSWSRELDLSSLTWQGKCQSQGRSGGVWDPCTRSRFPPWMRGWARVCPVGRVLLPLTCGMHRLCKQFLVIWLSTCACFVGLAAVSAMLMDSCILFICGKGWQQDTGR